MASRARPQIDHIVRAPYGFFVVLHHQHRIAQDRADFPARTAAAHCRARAARSKARQAHRARRAVSIQSASPAGCAGLRRPKASPPSGRETDSPAPPHVRIPAAPQSHAECAPRWSLPAPSSLILRAVSSARAIGSAGKIRNRHAVHFHRQAFGPQPLAVARRALCGRHEIQQILAIVFRGRRFQILLEIPYDPKEPCLPAPRRLAIKEKALNLLRKLLKRRTQDRSHTPAPQAQVREPDSATPTPAPARHPAAASTNPRSPSPDRNRTGCPARGTPDTPHRCC